MLFRSMAELLKCQRGEVCHGILRKIQSQKYVIDLYISFEVSLQLLLLYWTPAASQIIIALP